MGLKKKAHECFGPTCALSGSVMLGCGRVSAPVGLALADGSSSCGIFGSHQVFVIVFVVQGRRGDQGSAASALSEGHESALVAMAIGGDQRIAASSSSFCTAVVWGLRATMMRLQGRRLGGFERGWNMVHRGDAFSGLGVEITSYEGEKRGFGHYLSV